MEQDSKKFGQGPRELTGAVDLISHYKLLPHYEFFCKRDLPLALADTHYLHDVVGDTEIRKGEGMQLDQLIQAPSSSWDSSIRIQLFELDALREAFQFRENCPVDLPPADRGIPTVAGKSSNEAQEKSKKHKKHKDRGKEKEHKKHKHRHKDKDHSKDKDRDKKKDKTGHHEKKRKHDGDEGLNDVNKHKKSKHSTTRISEISTIKCRGTDATVTCYVKT